MNYSKNWVSTWKSDLKTNAVKALEKAKKLETIKKQQK
jgi:hypothetical protein